METDRLRWLHLSDLHFDGTRTWNQRVVLSSLRRYLEEKKIRLDLVFLTGDIANWGKEEEFRQAEDFLVELLKTVGLDARRLFLVPGNHDVDHGRIDVLDGFVVDGLMRKTGADDFESEIERVLGNPAVLSALYPRLSAFYDFTRRILGPARAWSKPWHTDSITVGGLDLGVLQLNSAWASGPQKDEKDRLLVGAMQVREALAELPATGLRIALLHHPLPWLAGPDEKAVGDILRAPGGATFILTGHQHESEALGRMSPDGTTLEFTAGATYVHDRWPKGCNLVELDRATGKGSIQFLAFSGHSGGFWVEDSRAYHGAPNGIWTFDLPPCIECKGGGRSRAQVDRYRDAAAKYHAPVPMAGLPHRGPLRNAVSELFVPLLAGPQGSSEGGLDPAALARSLLSRDARGRAARVVLLGDPGSGKTTLTRALTLWAAGGMELCGTPASSDLVPLRIPFRDFVADLRQHGWGLLDFLVRQSDILSCTRDRAFFEGLLREGRALVLLDGMDEVMDRRQRDEVVRVVTAFAREYENAPFLVTSRVVGYDDAPLPEERVRGGTPGASDPFPVFERLVLRQLSESSILELVQRWYLASFPENRAERERMVTDLQGALSASPSIQDLARNPLLATLICVVHRHRAKLPGERVKLYDEVVDTLLDTWHCGAGLEPFKDLDAGRQRRFLEQIALGMMEERASAETKKRTVKGGLRRPSVEGEQTGVVLTRGELVARLTVLAKEGSSGESVREIGRRIERWVDWLAARTGILVEQRPGWFGFLHLTLQEYLAACALDQGPDLLAAVEARAEGAAWRETLRLVLGLRANDPPFASALLGAFAGREALRDRVLTEALREEMELPADARRALVGRVLPAGDRQEALEALVLVARLSPRHRDAVRADAAEALLAWTDGRGLDRELAERLSDLVAPERLAAVAEHLRRFTRDGACLYWLRRAVSGDRERLARFFDHVPKADRERALALMEPWWREIPAGSFMMGSPDEDEGADEEEKPQHEVRILRAFWMLGVPVTWEMYECLDPGKRASRDDFTYAGEGIAIEGQDRHPVYNVSWYEAATFAAWVGGRLPREAEWEYACRAGDPAPWYGDVNDIAWHEDNSEGHPHPVAEKRPNGWGLFDMLGNVWEWTSGPFHPYRVKAKSIDPWAELADSGAADRVVRSGSWRAGAWWCRSACRDAWPPDQGHGSQGFRVLVPLLETGSIEH